MRELPTLWNKPENPTEASGFLVGGRVSAAGMFLKTVANPDDDDRARPVLIANSIAWHPAESSLELGVFAEHVLLGAMGFDVGQLARVEDSKRFTAYDRECFYQLLNIIPRTADAIAAGTTQVVPRSIDVTELLPTPARFRGRYCRINGTARRALRVQVTDPDVVQRFGISHYYEVEVFTNPAMTVRFVNRAGGDDKLFHRYPVVACFRELPDWLPRGETINAEVEFDGIFVKNWAYRSEYMSGNQGMSDNAPSRPGNGGSASRYRQVSPLFVGARLRPNSATGTPVVAWDWGLPAVFLLLIAGVAGYLWYQERSDDRFRRGRRLRALEADTTSQTD